MLPHFLCIGAMKAGTTWLQANLGGHRQAWLSPLKELRYFNTLHIPGPHQAEDTAHRQGQVARRIARITERPGPYGRRKQQELDCLCRMAEPPFDDAWYTAIWRFARPDQVTGDISPQYAVLPEAGIRHALALNPGIRVIALLRDQADRALSHMAMHAGPEPETAKILAMLSGPRWPVYRAQSDYAAWLSLWRDTLPAGALHIETMGRIRREPQAVLARICRFIGLPYRPTHFPEAATPVMASRAEKARIAPALPEIRAALAPEIAAFAAAWPELAAELAATG